ncbi:MAG: septum formation protein Maf [Planctomycetes bacterium]|nr:septum formation protein Maf [Planctomycetota bacterium]
MIDSPHADAPPPKLILASQSPRRRQLMLEAGYTFEVIAPDPSAECGVCSRETPPELVARLALQKAANVAPSIATGIVIGCDTVAECAGQILGKPENREHAQSMLQRLSGRVHHVYSGICLWRRPDNRQRLDVAVSRLRMDGLSESQLQEYLDSNAWEGKAGAFGFQDGLEWVKLLEGSPSNVVGLPMELLARMLREFGGVMG